MFVPVFTIRLGSRGHATVEFYGWGGVGMCDTWVHDPSGGTRTASSLSTSRGPSCKDVDSEFDHCGADTYESRSECHQFHFDH